MGRITERPGRFPDRSTNSALQSAFDSVPDLILCDIVIPGKNGLELTQIFKSDVRTSHIPVILLTAKDQENQKIEGMEMTMNRMMTMMRKMMFIAVNQNKNDSDAS